MEELASIIIVTYNHLRYLEGCLSSVLGQDYPHEVILVDNCSCDGTVEYVNERFPSVKVIENRSNGGYGAGNNLGMRHAEGEYAVILNPDVRVGSGWLKHLVAPLGRSEMLITTPKILLFDGSGINTCGNINHFTGLTFTRGLGESPENFPVPEIVSGISGACFALKRQDYLDVGGFDERFFLYNEDSDFSWRTALRGYRFLMVPESVMYHDYQLSVSPEKIFHLEKGRYLILRKYFSKGELLLLSPSLLCAEILTAGYAMLRYGRGGGYHKFRAIWEGILTDVDRICGDKNAMLLNLKEMIPVDQLVINRYEKFGIRFANEIFKWNFYLVKRMSREAEKPSGMANHSHAGFTPDPKDQGDPDHL